MVMDCAAGSFKGGLYEDEVTSETNRGNKE